jgi:hypothetical protein
LERFRWDLRIQARPGIPHALFERQLPVILQLGQKPVRSNLPSMLHLLAEV